MGIGTARSCWRESLRHMWRIAVAVARGGSSWLCLSGDSCPCNIPGETLPACDGEGGADAWHDSLDGTTCWDECLQMSTGICDAQPAWNWELLQRCVGGDLRHQKVAVVEVVAKSHDAAQADARKGSVLVQVSGTQVATSDFSHNCMMTLTIRLADVGHGSRLWMSERRVWSNTQMCGMIALQNRMLGHIGNTC